MEADGTRNYGKYGPLVGAVDQGTSSTRFLVFAAENAELITQHQVEVKHHLPQAGYVEEDPTEIMDTVHTCISHAVENLAKLGIDKRDLVAVGVTNQRETTIAWDKTTGKPLYNAIVWLDTRTTAIANAMIAKAGGDKEYLKPRCGLTISTYFSAMKMRWLIDNVPDVQKALEDGRLMFGTVDSWIIWNLTGGKDGGVHITDVTNASRTMLMDIESLKWHPYLLKFFDIPKDILPTICSSAEIYGHISDGPIAGIPISGCLGDQHAALVGQMCFSPGQAKNTYGTGCFLLYNTGQKAVNSTHGLLTTVAYKLGPESPTVYALEGSVAIAGASIRWLRDNMGLIKDAKEVEPLAITVSNTGGMFFVPAFSGLYAPYWQPEARGLMIGMTQATTKAHIVRAALEAVAFQTREVLEAMHQDSSMSLQELLVDGGMSENNLLMQIQADVLGIPVVRPSMLETTSLGAAMAAGSAVGVWDINPMSMKEPAKDTFIAKIADNARNLLFCKWKRAVERSMHWEKLSSDGEEEIAEVEPLRVACLVQHMHSISC